MIQQKNCVYHPTWVEVTVVTQCPWMSWGLWKIPNFEDCLEKFGCINLHVKKSFFYVLFNFDKIIFLNVTLGQIFWFNSSSAMLLEYINWRKNLNWC